MPNFRVYANGAGAHGPPNDPCFTVDVAAKNRREAINKVVKSRPDLKKAHADCRWAAHVIVK